MLKLSQSGIEVYLKYDLSSLIKNPESIFSTFLFVSSTACGIRPRFVEVEIAI